MTYYNYYNIYFAIFLSNSMSSSSLPHINLSTNPLEHNDNKGSGMINDKPSLTAATCMKEKGMQ